MNPRWLMRAKRWAQNPPSARQVRFLFTLLAICLAIYGFERLFGWPEALTVSPVGGF